MHPSPNPPGLAGLLSQVERLTHDPAPAGRLGLAFQAVTAVSLGVLAARTFLDTVREARRDSRRPASRHR